MKYGIRQYSIDDNIQLRKKERNYWFHLKTELVLIFFKMIALYQYFFHINLNLPNELKVSHWKQNTNFTQEYDITDFTLSFFQRNKLYLWHEAISKTLKLASPDWSCFACVAGMRNVYMNVDIQKLIPTIKQEAWR